MKLMWQGKSLRKACLDYGVAYRIAWKRLHDGYSMFEALYGIRHKFRKDEANLTGKRFGNLIILHIDKSNSKKNEISYICKCDCGCITVATKFGLLHGITKSCKLCSGSTAYTGYKHGLHGTLFYRKYYGIKYRCENPNSDHYEQYGGRGIKCLWNSFEEFKEDMYESYLKHVEEFGEEDTTIDRIDVNRNYCKENCRWATRGEQIYNKQNTLYYQDIPLKIFCNDNDLDYKLVWQYVSRKGVSIEDAVYHYLVLRGDNCE